MRRLCPRSEIVAVVKANAYGAGATGLARELTQLGVSSFAVATVEEARELRDAGIAGKVACLGPIDTADFEDVIEQEIAPTVFEKSSVKAIDEAGAQARKTVEVWVEVDTGLHRYGVDPQRVPELIEDLLARRSIRLGAVYSTLIESPEEDSRQIGALLRLRESCPAISSVPLSIASSHGILSSDDTSLDIVRPGLMLQGLLPSEQETLDPQRILLAGLRPVATWKTRVAQARLVRPGETVGYGVGTRLEADTTVVTLSVGWSDGYNPAITNAPVLIGGMRCRVISVAANATMVDANASNAVATGDEAVLIGRQGDATIEAAEIASRPGAVYRVFGHIPARVSRLWV